MVSDIQLTVLFRFIPLPLLFTNMTVGRFMACWLSSLLSTSPIIWDYYFTNLRIYGFHFSAKRYPQRLFKKWLRTVVTLHVLMGNNQSCDFHTRKESWLKMVVPKGFEPSLTILKISCSDQLNYSTMKICELRDSNHGWCITFSRSKTQCKELYHAVYFSTHKNKTGSA